MADSGDKSRHPHAGRHRADDQLVSVLLAGMTVRDAAAAVKVSERTISRRLADPEFIKKLDAARDELDQRFSDLLAREGLACLQTVIGIRDDDKAKPTDRLKACAVIFKGIVSWRELAGLTRRLEHAEAQVAGLVEENQQLRDELARRGEMDAQEGPRFYRLTPGDIDEYERQGQPPKQGGGPGEADGTEAAV